MWMILHPRLYFKKTLAVFLKIHDLHYAADFTLMQCDCAASNSFRLQTCQSNLTLTLTVFYLLYDTLFGEDRKKN